MSVTVGSSSEVRFQGLLEKQGRLPKSFMLKKYWCVLDENRLSYSKQASKVCDV